ncbi:MAG: Ppx/GppA family phosphatase [Candidatus Eremiobacteraeota bacterium]|nr:Ppx/GppA family phosphatase [Candidatus Eremiobacteraeota bacterium]
MLLGAIDVGTNSIHLIVVEMDPHFGTSRTVLKAREMVRLGGGAALARGHLGKKAVARGVEAIAKFAEAARAAGASDLRAVATSAVREASNREEFVEAVRTACDLTLDVLDEAEEARLIHLGVSRGYPIGERMACIFDIGGGSTEFIIGDGHRPYFLHSLRLGSLRLYDDYLAEGASQLGYLALERHVRDVFGPLAHTLSDYPFELLIGTSGTVMGLAALDAAASGVPEQRAHGYVLRLDRLRALQDMMLTMSPAERRKMPGMNPRRSDIIVAGNAIVMTALEMLGRDRLIVCERALRDGIVVDYVERNLALARKLGDDRLRRFDALSALAERLGADDVHGRHVAGLALQLFDGLVSIHGFEPADRDLLFGAALVHDVGRAVNVSGHHKHGAYVIRNAALDGWRPEEVETIATIVRYHRKAAPKAVHPEWASATPQARKKIEGLAGLLRIADGLDRRRLGVVAGLEVDVGLGVAVVRVRAGQDVAPELQAAATKAAEMFGRAFGIVFSFAALPIDPYEASLGENERSAPELSGMALPESA